jgi:hypothetical protein
VADRFHRDAGEGCCLPDRDSVVHVVRTPG